MGVDKPEGFPGGSGDKESACNMGIPSLISGLGRSPGERNGYPLQYSCLESSLNRGDYQATVYGVAESDTTEILKLPFFQTLGQGSRARQDKERALYKSCILGITSLWGDGTGE